MEDTATLAAPVEPAPVSRRHAAELPRPDLGEAFLWLVAIWLWAHLGHLLAGRIASAYWLTRGSPLVEAMGWTGGAVIFWAALGGNGSDLSRRFAIRACHAQQLLVIALIALPLSCVAGRIQLVVGDWFPNFPIDPVIHPLGNPDPWKHGFFYAGLLVPVVEEFLFRGFIGRGLVARHGAILGTLLTALLYGAMYLDPAESAAGAARGVVFQAAYLSTGSLLAPVLLHVLSSGLEFVTCLYPAPFLARSAILAVVALTYLLYRMRTVWLLANGGAWTPGFVSAEMPADGVSAAPSFRRPSWGVILIAWALYLIFAAVLAGRIENLFRAQPGD